ncbi:hypothetical protein [Tomitella biformata]|uniref:hypothetical protein n=1 Tax=Tomitella biformata TaxID=630403 RepID=UPI0011DDD88F|nr:hypothetical protein [Tomitella biformata]
MSTQLWTIVGVAVGALLSFLAQWILAYQQRSDERDRELRRTQRDVYTRFLAAVHRTDQAVTKFSNNDPNEVAAFEELRQANIELQDCIAAIGLMSPRDSYDAASQLADASLLSWEGGSHSTANAKRRDATSAAFIALARRDIGVKLP